MTDHASLPYPTLATAKDTDAIRISDAGSLFQMGAGYRTRAVADDGQLVDAQVRQLSEVECTKVFREVASGATTDRAELRRAMDHLEAGDVGMVTRLDRLARSTRNQLKTLAAIAAKKAGFDGCMITNAKWL